ncbi:MAG: hypothetical protein AB7V27_13295 [Candidatus Binatia bacterium]
MMRLRPFALLALTPLALAGCGTSGDSQFQPIETIYYVSGGPNLQFELVSDEDPSCGSDGTGIQSPNADHQFDGRIFQTPHLFVLENTRQPVRAVIRNLSTLPIQVDMFLGFTQTVGGSAGMIPPGQCRTIASGSTSSLNPVARGPEVRTEVCAPTEGLNTSCLDSASDRSLAFFATTGDLVASVFTNCILAPILDACRTPATFFWERPQDSYAAVVQVNPGQNPDGQPPAQVRLELYVNDVLREFQGGVEPIVREDF